MDETVTTPKKRKMPRVLILIAVLLIGGILAAILVYTLRNDIEEYVWIDETIQHSTDTPSEQVLPSNFTWKGAASDPKKITVESQSIDGFIQKVGVDQNKQIAVPNNIHIAGWFTDSVRPGEKGLSIIDGHVNGRKSNAGVFKQLPKLVKDDVITVTYGDNSTKKFKVFAAEEVKTEEAPSVLFSQSPSVTSQLNLITCVGTYVDADRTYDKRFIVQAELVQ